MDKRKIFYLLCLILTLCVQQYHGMPYSEDLTFPDDFLLGTASSNYQVEGAWNIDGRTESIWDNFLHARNMPNADTTSDFYHRYKEDISLLNEIGVDHFRFSLGWTRILPTGYTNNVNKKGVQFYHNVLDELEKYNITPVVTIYHFDHPQVLEEFGGWLNESMIDVYVDYARFVYEEYGSRIKFFTTINEVYVSCKFGYDEGFYAPGVQNREINGYLCYTNMLKAHALAYHLYDKEYRHKYHGQVGIAEVCYAQYDKNPDDVEAKDTAFAFDCAMILNPIFSEKGNFPEVVIRNVAERSALQGYKNSRFLPLSDEWVEKIRGSSDYLGLNHYSSRLASSLPRDQMLNWANDSGIVADTDPSWTPTAVSAFPENAEGMGVILRKLRDEYNNPPIYILENGIALPRNTSNERRMNFLYSYLREMLIAIKRDNCNVKMHTTWSLLDSFEFLCDYECRFGLIDIDFNDKNLPRKIRDSTTWYQSILKERKLLPPPSMM